MVLIKYLTFIKLIVFSIFLNHRKYTSIESYRRKSMSSNSNCFFELLSKILTRIYIYRDALLSYNDGVKILIKEFKI